MDYFFLAIFTFYKVIIHTQKAWKQSSSQASSKLVTYILAFTVQRNSVSKKNQSRLWRMWSTVLNSVNLLQKRECNKPFNYQGLGRPPKVLSSALQSLKGERNLKVKSRHYPLSFSFFFLHIILNRKILIKKLKILKNRLLYPIKSHFSNTQYIF